MLDNWLVPDFCALSSVYYKKKKKKCSLKKVKFDLKMQFLQRKHSLRHAKPHQSGSYILSRQISLLILLVSTLSPVSTLSFLS